MFFCLLRTGVRRVRQGFIFVRYERFDAGAGLGGEVPQFPRRDYRKQHSRRRRPRTDPFPAELPDHRYYIFGREGARRLAEETGLPLLAEIPLVQSVRESGDEGRPVSADDSASGAFYRTLAENVVAELEKKAR